VGLDSLDLNGDYAALKDLPLPCDSEIVYARQQRVTSGYLSDDNAAVVNGFDAEIRRLTEQTAKLERQLMHLGRGDDSTGAQLVSGSRISSKDTSPDAAVLRRRLQYVTMRPGQGHRSTERIGALSSDRHSVTQSDGSSLSKLRRHVARRHDDEHDSLIAGQCSDTAEVVDGREVNKHRLFTSAYGRKRYPMSEVAAYPRSSEKADLKCSVVVFCLKSVMKVKAMRARILANCQAIN